MSWALRGFALFMYPEWTVPGKVFRLGYLGSGGEVSIVCRDSILGWLTARTRESRRRIGLSFEFKAPSNYPTILVFFAHNKRASKEFIRLSW
jgi:hypothetical protein